MLIETVFTCAGCGESNDTVVDPSEGRRQTYVEDCRVCCQPNVLSIRVEGEEAEVEATLEH